jgi:hypothetical protein
MRGAEDGARGRRASARGCGGATAVALLVAACGASAPPRDGAVDAPRDGGAVVATDVPPDPCSSSAGRDGGSDAARPTGDASHRPADQGALASVRARRRLTAASRAQTSSDETTRATLATREIVAVERGHGGRSLAFRVTFGDGSRGYFKPEQSFSGMHWYAEIAAHRLDRALGLDRTPVVVGRRIAWSELAPAAGDDPRVSEIAVGEDGSVRGAMIEWIDGRLVPLRAPRGWERWARIDPLLGITPFQSARAWRAARAGDRAPEPEDAPELDTAERAAELSDLVIFDFLVHNLDRWSASSTNVRTRGPGGPLIFLDQGAGFSARRARLTLSDQRLETIQRFRRATFEAIRALDPSAYARDLDRDPLAPILTPEQLAHLGERRSAAIEHIEALVASRGEESALPW